MSAQLCICTPSWTARPTDRPRPSACGVCSTAAAASTAAQRRGRGGLTCWPPFTRHGRGQAGTRLPRARVPRAASSPLHTAAATRQAGVCDGDGLGSVARSAGRLVSSRHLATCLCCLLPARPFFCRAARKQRRNEERDGGGDREPGTNPPPQKKDIKNRGKRSEEHGARSVRETRNELALDRAAALICCAGGTLLEGPPHLYDG